MNGVKFPIPISPLTKWDDRFFFGLINEDKERNKLFVCNAISPGLKPKKRKTIRASPRNGKINQWVVGLYRAHGRPKFFDDNELEYPVQVIPWDYIAENNGQMSAAEFFWGEPSGITIKCDSIPLMGGVGNEGHIVIYDSTMDVFLKGFSYVGHGQIQCSDVKYLSSDDFVEIQESNQATPMTVDTSHQFLLLVPVQNNEHEERGVHSVLNVGAWQSLDKLFEEISLENKDINDKDGAKTQEAEYNLVAIDGEVRDANDEIAIQDEQQVFKDNGSDGLGRDGWGPLDKVILSDSVNGEDTELVGKELDMKHGLKFHSGDNTSDRPTQVTDDTTTEAPLPGVELFTESQDKDESDGLGRTKEILSDQMALSEEVNTSHPASNQIVGTMDAVPNPESNIEHNSASNPEDDSEEKPQVHKKDDRSPEEREMAFLERFKKYVKEECGFNYDDRDLERFHTCVKTGMMTLLGGDPGSGKSSLFELYARALAGDSKGCNFKQVDVNPTWMEPSDLMGYSTPNLNNSNGEKQFHESQCGLRSFLADLKGADERAPALVCFEEMNLARIELYFAEFIQLISRYELTSTKKNLPSYGGDDKQAPLIIPSDVRFVGTCNDDPTVKPMSNRFFDRSNFIRLSGDSKEWKRTSDEKKKNDTTASDGKEESPQEKGTFCLFARESGRIGECKSTMASAKDYGSWIKNPSREDSLKVGKKLDNILNEIRKELSAIVACPSPRVIGEILRYVCNRPFPAGVTDDTIRLYIALDEALVQRVISKCVPNALMRGKFEAAAKKVRETFEKGFKSAQGKGDQPVEESGDKPVEEKGEEIVSLTAERLDELEMETKSLFRWSGVEDYSNVNNAE